MGVRFHKSIRLLPFLYLNISKSGISFSLGAPGASLNLGSKGARGSVGLPGTGLSYRKTLVGGKKGQSDGGGAGGVILRVLFICVLLAAGICAYSILRKYY